MPFHYPFIIPETKSQLSKLKAKKQPSEVVPQQEKPERANVQSQTSRGPYQVGNTRCHRHIRQPSRPVSKMKLPSHVAPLHEATVKEMKDRVADKRKKAGQLLKRASALRGA